jgi:low temperature requirement protein LtrA
VPATQLQPSPPRPQRRPRPRRSNPVNGSPAAGVVARRRWVQPPRLRTAENPRGERHATPLELFFDLVFVVVVDKLAELLADDPSAAGVLHFLLLFATVCVAWVGYTVYADRFDTDDLLHRVLMFCGMLAIAAVAVNIPRAFTGGSAAFAIAYVAVRAVLVAMYLRVWHAVPDARGLALRYVLGFSLSIAIWLASLAVPEPLRFAMWLFAVLLEALTPTTARYFAVQMQLQASHMAERYGLFTLIVLGGALVAVVSGTADTNWAPASALCAAAAFIATAALWWTYFDCVDMGGVNRTMLSRLCVAYVHCLMYAAMTAFAVGTLLLIGAAAHGHEAGPAGALVGGGVATILLTLSAVDALAGARANRGRIGIRVVGSTAAAGLALAGGTAAPLELAALLDAVLLAGLLCEVWVAQKQTPGISSPRQV